jgi:hypothetical protein
MDYTLESLCQNICMVDWLKAAKVVNALGVVIVAIFVAVIQFRQYRTARAKFKLDLFEKRFQVFAGARRFLSTILRDAKTNLEDHSKYRAEIAEADFLFGADVNEFLKEIDRRSLNLWQCDKTREGVSDRDERVRLSKQVTEEVTWLIEQLPLLKPRFAPYMEFRKWK